MYEYTTIGLDVHKATITAAVLPPRAGQATQSCTIEHQPAAVTKLVHRLAAHAPLVWVYEAGPSGYDLHRQLTTLGQPCVVIAPGLIPVRPGDRVKTDRRDAEKLARLYRAGELTPVRVPNVPEEAARDLVRAREDALGERLRVRHRLTMLLRRQGRPYQATKTQGVMYRRWLLQQRFEVPALQHAFDAFLQAFDDIEGRLTTLTHHLEDLAQTPPYAALVQALCCLKGVQTLTALTCIVEAQDFHRFARATDFMGYTGLVPREHSSGAVMHRGGITKTGNAHLRRVLVETAWHYHTPRALSAAVLQRRRGCPPAVVALAKQADQRLHRKFARLRGRHKTPQVTVVAVAREVAGFVWAIGRLIPPTV